MSRSVAEKPSKRLPNLNQEDIVKNSCLSFKPNADSVVFPCLFFQKLYQIDSISYFFEIILPQNPAQISLYCYCSQIVKDKIKHFPIANRSEYGIFLELLPVYRTSSDPE